MEAFLRNNIISIGGEVHQQARRVINNVLTFLCEIKEDPRKLQEINFNKSRDLAAMICGVSPRTVARIRDECKRGAPSGPRGVVRQPRPVTNLDDLDKSVIKRIVISFYSNGEYPTLQKVVEVAKQKIDGFKCSKSSMALIVKDLGYKFKAAPDGRKQLMERRDIVCARLQFLRKLDDLKKSGDKRPRIYLDETWVYQNHSRKRVWADHNNKGSINQKIWKGGRLIVCHTEYAVLGFLPKAEWVDRAMKSKNKDFYSEINAEAFTEWFTRLLLSLEEPSVIIMDNASYDSKLVQRAPTSSSTKSQLQEWLQQNGIAFPDYALKADLLEKVKQHRPEKLYQLDVLVNEWGHEVIRLPPYHGQYNPIELIWAQVKGQVATRNITFKIAHVEKLVHEAIENVTIEDWAKCVHQAEALHDEDLQKAHLSEHLIINVVQNSDTDDEAEDDAGLH